MFRLVIALFGFLFASIVADITPDGTGTGDEGSGDTGDTGDGGATSSTEDGTGGTDESSDGDTDGASTGSASEGEGSGGDGDSSGDDDSSDAKYTDKDLDHHKSEARKSARSKFLKDLGVKSLEEAKKLLGMASESATFREVADRRIVRAEAKALAVDAGVRKDRISAVLEHADFAEIKVSDEGETDTKAISGALVKVLEKYPEWGRASVGKAPGNTDTTAPPTGIDAEIKAAVDAGDFIKAERLQAQKLQREGKLKH